MATGIDHVVIAVNNLDQSIADFTSAGFTVVPGGVHGNNKTHNALIAFADGSYFELIAWLDPATASRTTWRNRLEDGEGFIDYALRSADLHDEVKRLRADGLDTPDPEPGGRTRPDGQRVEWLNLRFDEVEHPWLPFYCHSTNDRSLRVPSGQDAVHPNGASGIASITIGVSDLAAAERDFAILAGVEYTPDLNLPEERSFAIGTTQLVLIQPGTADTDLEHRIALRGQVPISLELTTTGDTSGPIDLDLTHGAAMSLVR
jgi:catechol 2,3-dioxygenase-like lactoylglutathione lyase family enzyme